MQPKVFFHRISVNLILLVRVFVYLCACVTYTASSVVCENNLIHSHVIDICMCCHGVYFGL